MTVRLLSWRQRPVTVQDGTSRNAASATEPVTASAAGSRLQGRPFSFPFSVLLNSSFFISIEEQSQSMIFQNVDSCYDRG